MNAPAINSLPKKPEYLFGCIGSYKIKFKLNIYWIIISIDTNEIIIQNNKDILSKSLFLKYIIINKINIKNLIFINVFKMEWVLSLFENIPLSKNKIVTITKNRIIILLFEYIFFNSDKLKILESVTKMSVSAGPVIKYIGKKFIVNLFKSFLKKNIYY